jgi:hypothetical protein
LLAIACAPADRTLHILLLAQRPALVVALDRPPELCSVNDGALLVAGMIVLCFGGLRDGAHQPLRDGNPVAITMIWGHGSRGLKQVLRSPEEVQRLP